MLKFNARTYILYSFIKYLSLASLIREQSVMSYGLKLQYSLTIYEIFRFVLFLMVKLISIPELRYFAGRSEPFEFSEFGRQLTEKRYSREWLTSVK